MFSITNRAVVRAFDALFQILPRISDFDGVAGFHSNQRQFVNTTMVIKRQEFTSAITAKAQIARSVFRYAEINVVLSDVRQGPQSYLARLAKCTRFNWATGFNVTNIFDGKIHEPNTVLCPILRFPASREKTSTTKRFVDASCA